MNPMKFPLTYMWLSGRCGYPNLVADGLAVGIRPWWFDVIRELRGV